MIPFANLCPFVITSGATISEYSSVGKLLTLRVYIVNP